MEIKFGTSGWRAIIADEFTFENVRICSQAIADHLKSINQTNGVVIGSDARFMSPRFMEVAAEIFAANDIKVFLCVRDTPTPVISFEILRRKLAGGINFTASHNPPEYQGLKFSPAWGGPALPETTKDIENRANELMKSGNIKKIALAEATRKGMIEKIDPMETYLAELRAKINLDAIRAAKLKILVNPLYGTSRGYLDRILKEAGCQVTVMNDNLDPYFGNQPPEPSEAHIPDMIARMKEGDFDLGLATDGDADRFGVLGPKGRFYEPNQVLGMILDHMKNTRDWPGAAARSVATTHLVDAVARYHKIDLIETAVGFKFLGDLIAQNKIIMGGEESAGMTIRGHVPEKDGIIACLLVAEMVAMQKKPIAQIMEDLYKKVGTYLTRRLNFRLTEEEKIKAVANMKQDPQEVAGYKVKQVIRLDGTKCILENDAWVLVRFSGTEPVVRFYAEAHDEATLKKLCDKGEAFVKGQ
ncbi:MAG: phosphoglucomutase/phosphomannomutase family protein [Candidatus Riflebacteria bacterium]|nr:phosphoglucomutase/phosphomannomutase family protein [Candidatus Riflebacteria bacterium]